MVPGPSKVKDPGRMIPGPCKVDERLVVRSKGNVSTSTGVVKEASFGRPRGDYSADMVPGPATPNGAIVGTERTKQVNEMVESLIASGQNRERSTQMALAKIGNGGGSLDKAPEVPGVKHGDDVYGPFRRPLA